MALLDLLRQPKPPIEAFKVPSFGIKTYDSSSSLALAQWESAIAGLKVRLVVDFNRPIERKRADDFDLAGTLAEVPVFGTLFKAWSFVDQWISDDPSIRPPERGLDDQINDFKGGILWSRMIDPTGNTPFWYWVSFPAELYSSTPEKFDEATKSFFDKMQLGLSEIKDTTVKSLAVVGITIILYLVISTYLKTKTLGLIGGKK